MDKFKKGPNSKGFTNAANKGGSPAYRYNKERQQRGDPLYHELPSSILNPSTSGEEGETVASKPEQEGPKNTLAFFNAVASASGARLQPMNSPYFNLTKRKTKSQYNKWNRKVPFSSAEKRQLGLHLLPRKGLKFEQFVPLNAMWKGYMMDFLNVKELQEPGGCRDSELTLQLLRADYHGAFLTVTRSRCPSLVGASGIVAIDTKNTFALIGRDDKLRTVPKESSVFSLTLDHLSLKLFGKYLCVRPAERSVKKIKARMSADL